MRSCTMCHTHWTTEHTYDMGRGRRSHTGMCDIRLLCPIRFATCEHLDSFARGATDGHIGNETSDTGQLYPNTQLWQEHGLNVP